MPSGRFIDWMGTCEGRKIATNMGDLLQDRYRATMDHRAKFTGLDFEEGGKFFGSFVNVSLVVTKLV